MARPSVTLWLLNRCVDWDPAFLIAQLNENFLVGIGQRLTAANAARFPSATEDGNPIVKMVVNKDEEGKLGELMHEGKAVPKGHVPRYDEYFVPIPVKCVGTRGSAFWNETASVEGQKLLGALDRHMKVRLPPNGDYDPATAERGVGVHFGDVRMNLHDSSLGYYQLLRQASDQSGAQNILVGYSQGGTVARYLAFLDEHVAKPDKRCIHSIVTVQSPNRGSPVASEAKRNDVSRALTGILLSLPQWLPDDFRNKRIWEYLGEQELQRSSIAFIAGLLDAELSSFPNDPADLDNQRMRDTWLTARKWLSGLSGLRDLAFWDLDPARIAEDGSVLKAIDSLPLTQVRHGAVVGANNEITDLVRAALYGTSGIVKFLDTIASGLIKSLLAQGGDIWKRDGLSFADPTPGTIATEYLHGIPAGNDGLAGGLAALSHDFVIPSASQLLLPASSPVHLGHEVNPFANHLSGAACWPDWPDRDENDQAKVGKLLNRLAAPAPAAGPAAG